MLNGTLKPYLAYSAAAHAAGVVFLVMLGPGASVRPDPVYHISFIGAAPGIINRTPGPLKQAKARRAPKAAAAKRPAPQTDPDAFAKPGVRKPLPKPRFLLVDKPVPVAKKPAPAPTVEPETEAMEESPTAAAESGPAGGGGSVVAPDMPDFPYPWYITRVRSTVWESWAERFASGPAECGIMFTIMRDGRVVDLRIEFTSGDKAYDYAAITAIQNSGPFPALPPRYKDSFLKVHFEFRSN